MPDDSTPRDGAEPVSSTPPLAIGAPARDGRFIGRGAELARLRAILPPDDAAVRLCAIVGLPGIGKTALAAEHAYANAQAYSRVWWAPAATRAALIQSLAALGRTLDPALSASKEDEKAARAVLDRLARDAQAGKPWLLVYDGVEEPAAVKGLLPKGGAHAIVTSQRSDWGGVATVLRLGPLSIEEAAALLRDRSGRTGKVSRTTRIGRIINRIGQGATAERLADFLSCIPLALVEAAESCRRTGLGFDAYRTGLARKDDELSMMFTALARALERVEEGTEAAGALMPLLACCWPDGVPLGMFDPIISIPKRKREAAAAALERASLIDLEKRDGETFVVLSPLVQSVARARLEAEDVEQAAEAVLHCVIAGFPFEPDDPQSWPAAERLKLHAVAALAQNSDTPTANNVIILLVNYLLVRNDLEAAEPLLRRALAIAEADRVNPLGAVMALTSLAQVLRELDRNDEAEQLLRRALALCDGAEQPEDAATFTAIGKLGLLLLDTDRIPEAESLMRRGLEIAERAFGADDPATAIHMGELAQLLVKDDRFAEAEPLMRQALAIVGEGMPADHPAVCVLLVNMGGLLAFTARFKEAEPLLRRALAIADAVFGPDDHENTAYAAFLLARTLSELGQDAEALRLAQRSLDICERSLGPHHSQTRLARQSLANLRGGA